MSSESPVTDTPITAEGIVVSAVHSLAKSKDASFFRLRRGSELLHAMLEPVFPQVRERLRNADIRWVRDDNLACTLLLLPHVTKGTAPLAKQLAAKNYSTLRFQRLVAAEDIPELFTQLQRAVQFLKGDVSAFDLTKLVLDWTEANRDTRRKRLIAQYYGMSEN